MDEPDVTRAPDGQFDTFSFQRIKQLDGLHRRVGTQTNALTADRLAQLAALANRLRMRAVFAWACHGARRAAARCCIQYFLGNVVVYVARNQREST